MVWFCPGVGEVRRKLHHKGTPWDEMWTLQELPPPDGDEVGPKATAPLAASLAALPSNQPVVDDARPVVTTLLSEFACWLEAGVAPDSLAAALNEASETAEGAITVTELDLTSDGREDAVVRIPVMGLPLLIFVNQGGPYTSFEGYALPADFADTDTCSTGCHTHGRWLNELH